MEVGLSLGSNLGDRLKHLCAARRDLLAFEDTHLLAQSPVYETEPVDVAPEFHDLAYLNAVLVIDTSLSPIELRRRIAALEAALGRVRVDDRNAPRPVDVDMIYAGDVVSADAEVTLPHPRWFERRFVVEPLADVRPRLVLPPLHKALCDVLLALPSEPRVVVFATEW